jgi:Tol biopolymer transport system component
MALAGLIGVAAFAEYERRQMIPADARTFRTSILLPPDLNLVAGSASRFALSPDGRRLALSAAGADGRLQMWVRSLDALTAQPLSGTLNAQYPCWSPNGRFIAFVAQGTLKKIDASGGPATTLGDSVSTGSLTWNESDVILFNRSGESPGIYRVAASGGQAVAVTHVDRARGEIEHALPWFLPDGKHFLYYLSYATGSGTGAPTGASGGTFVGSLDSREESKPLLSDGVSAKYADGYLVFTRASTLMAQPFDPDRLTLGGEAAPIAEQVDVSGVYSQSAFSVSSGSILAYQPRVAVQSQLTWFDRSGKHAGTVGQPGDYGSVDLSPDRARAAVSVLESGGRSRDLWLVDMTRGDRTQITFGDGEDYYPVWSPDGSQIIFASRRPRSHDLYRKASSGAGGEESLYADDVTKFPFGLSPDGSLLVYNSTVNTPGSGSDMLILPIAENAKPSIFLQTPFSEGRGAFSPDGRWLAYVSNETGRNELYVTSFPGPRGKWRVSADGGDYPRWRRDGKELFFIGAESRLMNAAVNGSGTAFEVGAVTRMFELRRRVSEAGRAFPGHGYDVSADGQRILVNVRIEDSGATPITLLTNWITLVKH